MEAKGGVIVAGEVRRVHVVYFLSYGGQTVQPHFFKVHHASRAGVFLRDVKRWLADLRGKDMPNAFAWSYKRKYRSGYIWQDLVDDDLLTPISDNEYVILGSSKLSSSFNGNPNSPMKKKHSKAPEEEEAGSESTDSQSPESSILTDDDSPELDFQEQKPSLIDSSSRFGLAEVEMDRRSDSNSTIVLPVVAAVGSGGFTWPSSGNDQFPKRKSYSSGASHVFRNLITCGAVDTKDAILVVMSRRPGSRTESPATAKYGDRPQEGGARKSSSREKAWNDKNANDTYYATQKAVPATYKPASRPNCSQCGKPFKPEKMHKHMRSCPGMKSAAVTRKSSSPEKESNRKPMDVPDFYQPSSSTLA